MTKPDSDAVVPANSQPITSNSQIGNSGVPTLPELDLEAIRRRREAALSLRASTREVEASLRDIPSLLSRVRELSDRLKECEAVGLERGQQIEAAKRDSERLNEVEKLILEKRLGFNGFGFYTFPIDSTVHFTESHNIREAIDAAVASSTHREPE